MRKLKWAMLGTGYVSNRMAPAIQESQFAELTAVGSITKAMAKEFADKYSIPNYSDRYDDFLNDPSIDVIYIALPNFMHKEWIIRSANALKHILVEKPFTLNQQEATDAIRAVRQANICCMEGLMYLHHPLINEIIQIIDNQTLGDITYYHAVYFGNIINVANPVAGGSIRELGCYPLSLIRLLAKEEPIEIKALGHQSTETMNDIQSHALFKFKNNATAAISVADNLRYYWEFSIHGSHGFIKMISNPWLPTLTNNIMLLYLNNERNPIEYNISATKSLYTYQVDALSQRILNGDFTNYAVPSLQDSFNNIKTIDHWLDQIAKN